MEMLSRSELRDLMEQNGGPRVSIYLPTHIGRAETREDQIRFKNALKAAEDRMVASGLRRPVAIQTLEPGAQLLPNSDFWRHVSDGLAAFFSREGARIYRLPLRFDDQVAVGTKWHTRPLLPLFSGDGQFLILALSLNEVRLLQCTRYNVQPLELREEFKSLDDYMKYVELSKQMQYHTSSPSLPGEGRRSATRHGQGSGSDETVKKTEITDFLHLVNDGLARQLQDLRTPMVLAGVDYLCAMFREITAYPNVAKRILPGNADRVTPEDLHEKAWEIIEPYFLRARYDDVERYHLLASKGLSAARPEDLVPAAATGRVDTLFVNLNAQLWGQYNRDTREVIVHDQPQPGDEDLLDLATTQTLLHNGTVYTSDPGGVPGARLAAATLRY